MSLKLPSRTDTIKVIVKADSAIFWPESDEEKDEIWANYLKTLNEDLLLFKEGEKPTRFVMRKVLNYDQAQKVQNQQMTMKDGQIQVQMSFIMEEVRQSIVDIENPEYVPLPDRIQFKKDSDGGCSKEIVEGLHSIGVVMDLYTARQNVTGKFSEDLKKKS